MRLHFFSFLGSAALALTPGCEGGQTGDTSGNTSETGTTGCEEHREKLAGFDTSTDAGTAEQLLAIAERSFDAPLTWKPAASGQSWQVGPESGQSTIHLDVTRGANAYLLTYTAKQNDSGLDIGVVCPPTALGVDAHVGVTTDGGALAETYDTLLRSSTAGVATLSVPLDLDKLSGKLAVTYSSSHAKLVQTSLEATFVDAGTTGHISALEQVESGTGPNASTSASSALLAVWPASEACSGVNRNGEGLGVALSQRILGTTGNDTLAAVVPAMPVDVTWTSGDKTKLSVSIEGTGEGCFAVRDDLPSELGGGPTLSYPVTLSLKSEDGRLDGAYAGQVEVSGSGDERRVVASASLQLAVADVDKSGFTSVSVPTDSDGLLVQVESKLVSGSVAGAIRLLSVTNPPCLTEPAKPMSGSSSGASSPGCSGQSQTKIEAASWGE